MTPATTRRPVARAWRFLEDTSVIAGLYPAGAAAAAAQLTGHHPRLSPVLVAWLTGTSVYLLDRVKLADRLLDPADELAAPQRHAFIRQHALLLRLAIMTLAAAACLLAWRIHPIAGALVAIGHLVVVLYAHRPASPLRPARVKDVFVLKNAIVGIGIAGFVTLLDGLDRIAHEGAPAELAIRYLAALAFLACVITADAAASDLDDTPADQRYNTSTLATRFGARTARRIVIALSVVASAAWFITLIPAVPRPVFQIVAWSVLTPLTLAAALRSTGRVRARIDLRLPLIAILAGLVQYAISAP